MSELIADTPSVPLNTWCPECGGPAVDEKAAMAYCVTHAPNLPMSHVATWGEAGGDGNTVICNFLHRRQINELSS